MSDTKLVWRHTLREKTSVVFDAYTKPEPVKRWWAPKSRGLEMLQCEADVRVGGAYVCALDPQGEGRGDVRGQVSSARSTAASGAGRGDGGISSRCCGGNGGAATCRHGIASAFYPTE